MVTDLDNINFGQKDPENYIKQIERIAKDCLAAWQDSESIALPNEYSQAGKIVLLGMGGSGIASEVVKDLLYETGLTVEVVHDYTLPGYVDEKTLVIANSYSGNTEEVLTAFSAARQRQAMLFAVTTGGKLELLAKEYNAPIFKFNYPSAPRAAFPYLFVSLLAVFKKLGYLKDADDFAAAVSELKKISASCAGVVPLAQNPAKQLAAKLHGNIPFIYSSAMLKSAALRFKAQFNENSKSFAASEILPELNHNSILGYEHPAAPIFVLILQSHFDSERILERQRITLDLLKQHQIPCQVVSLGNFDNRVIEILAYVILADFSSYYLAMQNDVNPTLMTEIELLKQRLAKS